MMLQGDSEDDERDELECDEGVDEVDHDIDLESERLLDSVDVEPEERESNSQSSLEHYQKNVENCTCPASCVF